MEYCFKTLCLSSLTKVFADEELQDVSFSEASALQGEVFSFQIAYKSNQLIKNIKVGTDCSSLKNITVRTVGLVPSEFPCYHDHDDYILRSKPGLYPDPLYPMDKSGTIVAFPDQWRSLWITVQLPKDCTTGVHSIGIHFYTDNEELLGREVFNLEVIPCILPEQKLIVTEWFHADCLAVWYNAEAFSKRHWEIIGAYLQSAVSHGINMILTPVFTPPLDTAVDGERLTTQLVEVKKEDDRYSFDFSNLEKWVELSLEKGVEYFEISHLFTQWGAKHAPKIIAEENGVKKRIFGWETDASGTEYRSFLSCFLPSLIGFFEKRGLHDRIYFHISDEPSFNDFDLYQKNSSFIRSLIGDYPTMDALSDLELYQSGAVMNPIPNNFAVKEFLEVQAENLWTYYCCGQYKHNVSNRFFNMPSARNRILGVQLYKFNLKGFLHWGYNFWNTERSLKSINPYINTDAGYSFPSGDAFLVYPGENGPVDSIRYEVFAEAVQDLRALKKLESLISREKVLELLEENLDSPITFSDYPKDMNWLLKMRQKVNDLIKINISSDF